MIDSIPIRKPLFTGVDSLGRKVSVWVHPQMNELDEEIAFLVTMDAAHEEETFAIDLVVETDQLITLYLLMKARLGSKFDT